MSNPLREAAANLPGHWYQGGLSDEQGNFCGIGHLQEAMQVIESSYDYDIYETAINAMHDVASEQYPERVNNDGPGGLVPFAQFNDHPSTVESEVVAVMEKAAVVFDERV